MANAFAQFGMSDAELMAHIAASAEVDSGLDAVMENEIVPYARSLAPVDRGDYAAGIKVTDKAKHGKGTVTATHWTSHFIEDGTKADPAGTKSRFGPNTPTPEFAVMQRTANHFGGTVERDDE
jgi:hypothetical protein